MRKGYAAETITMPVKELDRITENLEDVKGTGEYLAAGWDPTEKRIMAQIERNNAAIYQATKRNDWISIRQLCAENDSLIGQWHRGNEREDVQHVEIPQAADMSLGIMYRLKQEPSHVRSA